VRRVIVGTAGHIDHGKTRLVEALTGVDCDRWAEEKRRGITIDIGFAHLLADDLQVGFVDVPGHERFLHNALAGLGGIRVMLLVVAADEGVKPQTREHLAVCDLLAIPAGIVAMTKSDVASSQRQAAVREEIGALLAGTRFAGCEVLPVSSLQGDGIETLKRRLVEVGGEHAQTVDPRQPARLPVDRAFHVKGRGLVVTGTLAAGTIRTGGTLNAAPNGGRARVRGIQVHGTDRESAEAGERVALQLAGIEVDRVPRGTQLTAPGGVEPGRAWLAECRLLPEAPKAIRGSTPVRVHLFSAEIMGQLRPLGGPLEPGDSGVVEIRLAEPVAAARGDRYVVRRPSPAMTLGGGRVLDPHWRRRRGGDLDRAARALQAEVPAALHFWVEEAGEGGARAAELAVRLGWTEDACRAALDELAAGQKVIRVPTGQGNDQRWLTGDAFRRIERRARKVLGDYFAAHRMQGGMPRAQAVAGILPGRGAELAAAHLHWLEQRKVLEVSGDKVALPGREADLTGGESKLAAGILAAYEAAGLAPPAPSEVQAGLGAKAQIAEGVTRHLLERKKLSRLPGGLLIATAAVERLRRELEETASDTITIGEFKKRYELSRKWAIPLLEHLDSIGATRRVGNERQIVRRRDRDDR
jgi:selenocysteine-specific elongation factor